MTSEYSIIVDWGNEWEKWTNHGESVARDRCEHYDQDKNNEGKHKDKTNNIQYSGWCESCEIYEDSNAPMMNYAYPLRGVPSDDEIYAVIKETCLTVMENNDTGEYFLALCGGGMDLSQDVALAYLLAGESIPDALAYNVSTQYGLSKSGKKWLQVMEGCEESLRQAMANYGYQLKRIRDGIKKGKAKIKDDGSRIKLANEYTRLTGKPLKGALSEPIDKLTALVARTKGGKQKVSK